MIVVATADFEVYHEVVTELRERGVDFTTVEPDDSIPDEATVVITATGEDINTPGDIPADVTAVTASAGNPRTAVEEAVGLLRNENGQTIVGIDPGDRPGIAVLVGERVVATFQVPAEQAADVLREELEGVPDPLVRIGDGARLVGARIIDDIEDLPVELVDETGTTPYLGTGTRGMGDVLAAVNIARIDGEQVTSRDIQPTAGELQRIKNRSREQSEGNRAIGEQLARKVASGDLTMEEALDEHREG